MARMGRLIKLIRIRMMIVWMILVFHMWVWVVAGTVIISYDVRVWVFGCFKWCEYYSNKFN